MNTSSSILSETLSVDKKESQNKSHGESHSDDLVGTATEEIGGGSNDGAVAVARTLRIATPRVFTSFLIPARYKGAYGGRGSGKSHEFAKNTVVKCLSAPGTRGVCVREVQKSLKESVKRLVEDKIRALDVEYGFGIFHDHIVTPGRGVLLFQGLQDHTAESIKSLEGFDFAWAEEAQTMSHRSLEFIRPTIRKPGSELWFSWNPRSASDAVDALLRGPNPPPGAVVVQANYADNPFFPNELEAER